MTPVKTSNVSGIWIGCRIETSGKQLVYMSASASVTASELFVLTLDRAQFLIDRSPSSHYVVGPVVVKCLDRKYFTPIENQQTQNVNSMMRAAGIIQKIKSDCYWQWPHWKKFGSYGSFPFSIFCIFITPRTCGLGVSLEKQFITNLIFGCIENRRSWKPEVMGYLIMFRKLSRLIPHSVL